MKYMSLWYWSYFFLFAFVNLTRKVAGRPGSTNHSCRGQCRTCGVYNRSQLVLRLQRQGLMETSSSFSAFCSSFTFSERKYMYVLLLLFNTLPSFVSICSILHFAYEWLPWDSIYWLHKFCPVQKQLLLETLIKNSSSPAGSLDRRWSIASLRRISAVCSSSKPVAAVGIVRPAARCVRSDVFT